jgi:hypothetical protein
VKFAIVAPVTKPAAQSPGRWRVSSSPRRATRSKAAAAGDSCQPAAFWSQAAASQRRHRRRQRAADDPAEKAAAGHRHGGRRTQIVEHGKHRRRIARSFRHRLVELCERGDRARRRHHGAIVERFQVADFGAGTVTDAARRGQGPGEFQFIAALLPLGGDSTLAADMVRRWLILDGDKVVATLPPDNCAALHTALELAPRLVRHERNTLAFGPVPADDAEVS